MSQTVYVHTWGDSTLDSFYWSLVDNNGSETAAEECVEEQLKQKLNSAGGPRYQLVSHAYDGFTTANILRGGHVGAVLSIYPGKNISRTAEIYLRNRKIDPRAESYFVHPMNDLKASIAKDPNAIHHVVISVGGNDFRERIFKPFELLKEIPNVQKRYLEIVKEVSSTGRNIRPILMFQYRTDANNDDYGIYILLKVIATIHFVALAILFASVIAILAFNAAVTALVVAIVASLGILYLTSRAVSLKATRQILSGNDIGMVLINNLIEKFYQPILQDAKLKGIPILDLTNTFNPYKPLYSHGIEPGKEGAALIAEGIDHIVKHHDFNSDKSILYAKKDGDPIYLGIENQSPSAWTVAFPIREEVL